MPNTNGHDPKTAVLYVRVSTDEQAKSGYSLAQQLEALRNHAAAEGYEVLEEVFDPGQSGASLERPGMDRVRDLVADGGVSVVLAQDRDRFSREPAYSYLLRREFEEHGTALTALNDRGDESPEGELTDGILDQLALPPNGGRFWHTTTIRDIVLDDCYRPHTFEELRDLVSPEVASRLDPDKSHGVSWYNRRRVATRQVAEDGPEGRRYRRVQKTVEKPRSEWVAVPVPDAGIARDTVIAARHHVRQNRKTSSAGGRSWELSGGIVFCAECGMRLLQDRRSRSRGAPYYHYYRCQTRRRHGEEACPNGKSYPAEKLEGAVWEFVSGLMSDPDQLRHDLERMIELERGAVRGDPRRETKVWLEQLAETDRKRSGFQDMAAEGLITLDELRAKLAALEEVREAAKTELEILDRRRKKLDELEQDKETVMEHYAQMAPEVLDSLTPEERQRFYSMLRLKVMVEINGDFELSGAFTTVPDVCTGETASRCCGSRTPGGGPTFSVRMVGTDEDVRPESVGSAKAQSSHVSWADGDLACLAGLDKGGRCHTGERGREGHGPPRAVFVPTSRYCAAL